VLWLSTTLTATAGNSDEYHGAMAWRRINGGGVGASKVSGEAAANQSASIGLRRKATAHGVGSRRAGGDDRVRQQSTVA